MHSSVIPYHRTCWAASCWWKLSAAVAQLRAAVHVFVPSCTSIIQAGGSSSDLWNGKQTWVASWRYSLRKQSTFVNPPLVSPPNGVRGTSAEIPYWWRVTSQIEECFRLVEANFLRGATNQKHFPDLGSDTSSVWNFCSRFSDVILREHRWWHCEMSTVFFGYSTCGFYLTLRTVHFSESSVVPN